MIKIISLSLSLIFVGVWIFRRFRQVNVSETAHIPVGVSKWTYLVVGLFLLMGPLILGVGGLVKTMTEETTWKKTMAKVIELKDTGKHKGRTRYKPIVKFQDETGADVIATTSSESADPPKPGADLAILYNPSNSTDAVNHDPFVRWGTSILLLALGGFLLFFAGGAAVQVFRIQNQEKVARHSPRQIVHGRLLAVKKNFFLSLRHATSWRLIAEYKDSVGRTYRTESEPIWTFNPDEWSKIDTGVPIVIDPLNPESSWILVQNYFLACKEATS